jgi:retron-type reverse transcriptase
MKSYKNLHHKIYNISNLILAWRKARKGKTKKLYVKEFEKDTLGNILKLYEELKDESYFPKPLKTFILRDPKTRKISKSDFRDRIVHHALIRVLEPIFDKIFIYDSCANRKGKGNLFALNRFDKFKRKVSRNGKINGWLNNNQVKGYCLKADIKHYFQEVDHEILLKILKKKINDKQTISLIIKIIKNNSEKIEEHKKGMPLGNLTSQFFANIYLNELDYFIKHKLKAKYYIRYVDDFVILHESKEKLRFWKDKINEFLENELKLELHPDKSKIIPLSNGIDFVGFRNFYYFRLLRKRNITKMFLVIKKYQMGDITGEKLMDCFKGWQSYSKWADSHKLRSDMLLSIDLFLNC